MKIKPYIHRCIIESGHAAGNKYSHEVEPYEFECDHSCENCGEPLVSSREMIAHIYQELYEAELKKGDL